ncbi:hypothetical protein [Synechococcus sp. BMK-MC-1]|uniref:hypothetical protein n=1 Tax=Synechococcus sp. BMK-MC-1 TaxID=1442551 RepID=UPI0016454828|nr:hypothetical protein [Synechococcus sp. BMK-MC-1]
MATDPPPAGVAGEQRGQHRCCEAAPVGTRARGNRTAYVDVDVDHTTAASDHARVGAGNPERQHTQQHLDCGDAGSEPNHQRQGVAGLGTGGQRQRDRGGGEPSNGDPKRD